MNRNDMAPALAGLILGDNMGRIFLERFAPSDVLPLVFALIYVGWLVLDVFATRTR